MKATDDKNVFRRGKHGVFYVRRRIPRALLSAYPGGQTEIARSLRTADSREARSKAILELAAIEREFAAKRSEIDLSRASEHPLSVRSLTDEQLAGIGDFYSRQVLLADERRRERGLDDEEFEGLGSQLQGQRAELARMLAQGRTAPILPALRSFLHLCGISFTPGPEEEAHAAGTFLRAVVRTLDEQLARHRGDPVEAPAEAPGTHPLYMVAPHLSPSATAKSSWSEVFKSWSDYVDERPKSTIIAYQTAWSDLERFAATNGIRSPGEVTPLLMTAFVKDMRSPERSLAVSTTNGRLSKVKEIYKIACGKHELAENPATHTLGARQSAAARRRKKRLPFSTAELELIFGSRIFTTQHRSQGQSGEASYWIPILMFYTGARPEELAGLALADLRKDPQCGWYLDIVDRPCAEDRDLFDDEPDAGAPRRDTFEHEDDVDDDDEIPESHRRTLKSGSSVRKVPVANELIELGLLRYAVWVRSSGSAVFFPTLRKDWHGKLSGSLGKFFGRYLRSLGINERRKVLYSLRHNMKDLLEAAGIRSKYVKRFLGHASGDGPVTDGYGSGDVPFELMARYFVRVRFPKIPALPWQPAEKSGGADRREPRAPNRDEVRNLSIR
ncbi:MAG: DUF6538 domain-containing protein [Steroidobacteraceae bacterium]